MAGRIGKVTINVPQVRIQDYFWVIAGIPKSGKTSLFAKLIEQVFGDADKGFLLAFEKGYQALRVRAGDVNDWDDLESWVTDLVENKKEYGIEIVGIDTADVMYDMAVASVIKDWNKANPGKRTKDIGGVGAKGNSTQGFGAGYAHVKTKIRSVVDRLMKAGYGVMTLTHSKDKKVEQKDGLEYDQLNLSLSSSAREIFVNMADFIVFITIEKEKVDDEIITKRYMYFRSDGYVEAGSRFTNVPDRIEYNIDGFLGVFKHAVESEFEKGADLEQIKQEQAERREKAAEVYIEEQKNADSLEELVNAIEDKIKGLSKSQKVSLSNSMKEAVGTNDYKSLEDADQLKIVLDIVNEIV